MPPITDASKLWLHGQARHDCPRLRAAGRYSKAPMSRARACGRAIPAYVGAKLGAAIDRAEREWPQSQIVRPGRRTAAGPDRT
jgi:hypothetical protein